MASIPNPISRSLTSIRSLQAPLGRRTHHPFGVHHTRSDTLFLQTFSSTPAVKQSSSLSSSSSSKIIRTRFKDDPEDGLIRSVFDRPWLHSTLAHQSSSSSNSAGLFGYPQLQQPIDLVTAAQSTLRRSALIVERICSSFHPSIDSHQPDPIQSFLDCIRCFDRLSDGLCRIIDSSELIRNLHPNQPWVQAANEAHSLLCRYMNTLNTHKALYDALDFTLNRLPNIDQQPELFAARTVGLQFLRDFQRHGIHLSSRDRHRLVNLSDQMLLLGRTFFAGTSESQAPTYLTKLEAQRMNSMFTQSLRFDSRGISEIDPMDWQAHTLLRQHPDQSVRRRVWLSQHQCTDQQINILEALLKARHSFARLTGKSNWAEVVLEDKMTANPENVMTFLNGLANETRPMALKELEILQNIKRTDLKDPSARINSWDRDYYANMLKGRSRSPRLSNLSAYFSVGTCLQGLSRLFSLIYGISFRVESCHPNEVWHESVVKLGVIDEDEGRIGTIYCDLFDREDKTRGAAHYTVLCSRRTDLDDEINDFKFWDAHNLNPLIMDDIYASKEASELLRVPTSNRVGIPGTYQRPIVVFSCTFDPPDPDSRQPSLLAWSDVETLFHEMGHAMHSMIGQTEYHNVSGTRCATDFVELPSILMERFASSRSVLSLFSRHYSDDERELDLDFFEKEFMEDQTSFKALETNSQIVLAVLDQHLHSNIIQGNQDPHQQEFDSSLEYSRIDRTFNILPEFEDDYEKQNVLVKKPRLNQELYAKNRWQGRFGHLYGYGASYYSYLFDRVISQKLWTQVFMKENQDGREDGVLSRRNGERLKRSILSWGGSKEPWSCLSEFLNDPKLANDPHAAIRQVGKWGLWK